MGCDPADSRRSGGGGCFCRRAGMGADVSRVEVIGDCRLYAPLDLHVTGLAKALKICEIVRRRRRGEQPERFDVVHGYGCSNNLSASLARASVAFDRKRALLQPSLASIGGNATNPLRRLLSLQRVPAVGDETGATTKSTARLAVILADYPRLFFKLGPALGARANYRRSFVHLARLFAGEGVRRSQPSAPFVSGLVVTRHDARLHVPFPATREATEAGFRRAIRFHRKGRRANFARLFDHISIVAQNMAKRTTGVAYRQPRLFSEPQPKPKQEALL